MEQTPTTIETLHTLEMVKAECDAAQVKLEAWRSCADTAMVALAGCTKRLRITLAEATGEPVPLFFPPAPSALDNIHAVAAATAEYEKLKAAP